MNKLLLEPSQVPSLLFFFINFSVVYKFRLFTGWITLDTIQQFLQRAIEKKRTTLSKNTIAFDTVATIVKLT